MIDMFLVDFLRDLKYFSVFSILLGVKMDKGKKAIAGLISGIIAMLTVSLFLGIDSFINGAISWSIILLLSYHGQIMNKIILFSTIAITINYADMFFYAILSYAMKGSILWYFTHDSTDITICENIIFLFVVFIIALVSRRGRKKDWLNCYLSALQWLLLSGGLLGFYYTGSSLIMFLVSGQPRNRERLILLLSFASVLTIACILAFFIYSNKLKKENELHMQNIRLYADNRQRTRDYLDAMKSLNDDMQRYRHDFRHHVAALEGLVEDEEYAELKGYLDQLAEIDEDLKQSRVIYTGNYVVDVIICGIKSEEAFRDVEFVCDGVLPECIDVRDTDLCTVLANGLENAMEASLICKNAHIVQLRVGCYGGMIKFQIKNTYDDSNYEALAANDFRSTKTDGGRHGYGVKNMRRVVKKYHGRLEYHIEKECVTTEIYLQQGD